MCDIKVETTYDSSAVQHFGVRALFGLNGQKPDVELYLLSF